MDHQPYLREPRRLFLSRISVIACYGTKSRRRDENLSHVFVFCTSTLCNLFDLSLCNFGITHRIREHSKLCLLFNSFMGHSYLSTVSFGQQRDTVSQIPFVLFKIPVRVVPSRRSREHFEKTCAFNSEKSSAKTNVIR